MKMAELKTLATADVWTILDLIAAEFESDPMSTRCFDLGIVERAIELSHEHRRGIIEARARLGLPPEPRLDWDTKRR